MTESEQMQELLDFFKALAEANRLKIVAMLAQEPLSVEELAEMLDLSSSTVSHHLSRLAKVGLVSARAEGHYNVYQLDLGALTGMAERLLAKETLPAVAADVDMDAYDRKVLNTFLSPEGRIEAFPAQQKKEAAILRYVVQRFEHNRRYTEKETNEILSEVSEDTARLRRHLVDFGFMDREGGGGAYWRIDEPTA